MSRPLILLLSLTLYWASVAAAQAAIVDRVYAVVNNDVITESELLREIELARIELRRSKQKIPSTTQLRREILERMVLDRVQMQHAERLGLAVSEQEVDSAMAQVAARNQLTQAQLRQALQKEGIELATYRQDLRRQLTIRRLVEREVNSRIQITESEIDSLVQSLQKQSGTGPDFSLAHILIQIPDEASAKTIESKRELALTALEKIQGGVDFEQVAEEYSDSATAASGGQLGWRKSGQLPTLFLETVDKLKPGQVSEVIRGDNGFHILKLNDRRGGDTQMVEQYRARHILMKSDGFLNQDELRDRMTFLRERIMSGEDFATLAQSNSEDPGTRANGGDLGWQAVGGAVREFEQAVSGLEIDEISGPVKTQFGYHIIQLLDRRRHPAGEDLTRSRARRQLYSTKSEERYEDWVRQLRNQSFVEYKLENI